MVLNGKTDILKLLYQMSFGIVPRIDLHYHGRKKVPAKKWQTGLK